MQIFLTQKKTFEGIIPTPVFLCQVPVSDCLAASGEELLPQVGRVLVLSLARNQGDYTWVSGTLSDPLGILGGRVKGKKKTI